jgi:hypothetical protein
MNRNYKALMAFAFVLTAALVFVEAWLGAQALVIYSKRVVFDVADALQMGTALPLAIAISTATLLISAASGFIKGSESLTEQDEEMKEHELQMRAHEQEVKRQQDEYRDSLTRWESDKQGRVLAHQERLARMEAEKQEMDHYRKSPDFQALLKYIGRINTLNLIITEEEEKMKGDRIARGYEKAAIK